jgi:uncharacterized protein (TIGR00730 family)
MLKHICVFCGSYSGNHPIYLETTQAIGKGIAQSGYTLVYGGGKVGLMGAVADAALAAGGAVVGVMPKALVDKELAHTGLTELHVVDSMHTRKAMMAERADAFITLPGGFGTLDELFEIITWLQLGFHRKPIALLNMEGYFDPIIELIEHMAGAGFIKPEHRQVVMVSPSPEDLLSRLPSYEAPNVVKWIHKEDL